MSLIVLVFLDSIDILHKICIHVIYRQDGFSHISTLVLNNFLLIIFTKNLFMRYIYMTLILKKFPGNEWIIYNKYVWFAKFLSCYQFLYHC